MRKAESAEWERVAIGGWRRRQTEKRQRVRLPSLVSAVGMGERSGLALRVTLLFWLLVSLSRQVTDLIGRLWIPLLFDTFQVVVCIIGVFAVWGTRRSLHFFLFFGSLVSAALNASLFLLWLQVRQATVAVPLLALAMPFSFSFWTRFTPFCPAHFDVQSGQWQQRWCWVASWVVEAALALLHCCLALCSASLSLSLLLCSLREKPPSPSLPSLPPRTDLTSYANYSFDPELAEVGRVRTPRSAASSSSQKRCSPPPLCENGRVAQPRLGCRSLLRSSPIRLEQATPHNKETRFTSLVSFDPKRSQPIQVRELEDRDSAGSREERFNNCESAGMSISNRDTFQITKEGGSRIGGHSHSEQELQLIHGSPAIHGKSLLV